MAALNKNFVIELKEAYDKLEATRLQIDTELKGWHLLDSISYFIYILVVLDTILKS